MMAEEKFGSFGASGAKRAEPRTCQPASNLHLSTGRFLLCAQNGNDLPSRLVILILEGILQPQVQQIGVSQIHVTSCKVGS
jgi:hypothetical protein